MSNRSWVGVGVYRFQTIICMTYIVRLFSFILLWILSNILLGFYGGDDMLILIVFIGLLSTRRPFVSRRRFSLLAGAARARTKTVSLGALFGFQDQWVVQTARRRDRFRWFYAVVYLLLFFYPFFHLNYIIFVIDESVNFSFFLYIF